MSTLNIIDHTREWSNLPTDLLQEIMSLLHWADRVRLRCVCKNWLYLPFQRCHHTMDKLPWKLVFARHEHHRPCKNIFLLYDPIHEKHYSSIEISLKEEEDCSTPSPRGTSKHGWVFFSTEKEDTGVSFTLFSPFTREIVTLPDLHYRLYRHSLNPITFSTEPTSRDCVFFILLVGWPSNKTAVGTYRRCDKQWITKTFTWGYREFRSLEYFEGSLYCMHRKFGILSVYHVAEQEWRDIDEMQGFKAVNKSVKHNLMQSNGDLLIICNGISNYSFDRSRMDCFPEKSLLNQALFIGKHNAVLVPAVGETKHIENKIFYYDRDELKSKFYNFIDGKTYNCKDSEYNCLLNRIGGKDALIVLPKCKINPIPRVFYKN